MKVQRISRKLIKPLTPTPPSLNKYRISFVDQTIPHASCIPVILFYESKPESDLELEESLAKTLVHFYPLAGRFIHNHLIIDCSDQGAVFVEAEAPDVDLASIIKIQDLNGPFVAQEKSASPPLLSVQATRFACCGMAVAVTVSHRVFDASSLSTFLAAWSSNTATPNKTVITPWFNLPSVLPCSDEGNFVNMGILSENVIVVKKLVFDRATLARVRSRIGKPVSSTRVACAIIARACILLDGVKRGGTSRGFYINQAINMRERTITPIPKHALGNFAFWSLSRRVGASEAGISKLVDLMGESVRKDIGDLAEIVSVDRDGPNIIIDRFKKLSETYKDPDTIHIRFSDWSKFGFYEVDFGWGKACLDELRKTLQCWQYGDSDEQQRG